MKRSKRLMGIAAIATAITVGVGMPASAETSYVGGGTWYHGFSGVSVYSTFYHDYSTHRSSVTTSYGYYSSPWTAKRAASYASLQSSISGNKANWDLL